ncbi:UNVERIFIED_CONTAM: hypothetical protein NCL1_53853 [Trichonephila clavipes]
MVSDSQSITPETYNPGKKTLVNNYIGLPKIKHIQGLVSLNSLTDLPERCPGTDIFFFLPLICIYSRTSFSGTFIIPSVKYPDQFLFVSAICPVYEYAFEQCNAQQLFHVRPKVTGKPKFNDTRRRLSTLSNRSQDFKNAMKM